MIFLLLGTITQIVLSKEHVVHDGGYCGTHAMPYRVSVNDQGRLKLSCNSLPSCIDLEQNYQSSRNQSSKEEDDTAVKCDPFKETVCSGELEWTAGLMEVTNGSRTILKAACCSYHGMKYSRLMKTIFLGHDDRFDGGLVQMQDNKLAFDVIKEIRKTMNRDHKMQYIVTVHRIVCGNATASQGVPSRGISRNKRRLNNEKREQENNDDMTENENRYRGSYGLPGRRRHPYRRRPSARTYDDEYYDYEYEVYVPRQMLSRRRSKGNRLWPFARAYADGGIFDPNDLGSSQVLEPDLTIVDSNSRSTLLTQLPPSPLPVSSNTLADPLPSAVSAYQQPQPLPQYVPAYREPPSYASGPSYPVAPQFRAQQVPLQQAPYQPVAVQQAAPAQYPSQYPSQYYPYYPNNPGLNTIFEQMQCFSGDMEVETPYGMKSIKDLEVGDMVLSIDEFMITFSPVIMFLHKLEEERAEFLHIHTEQGDSLKLTENHLLYITNCGSGDPLHLTAAKEARPGQCLQITTENFDLISRRITSISKVIETGIYAPLTSTGDIVVNRYLVSCHSNLALKTLQQTFFSVYRSLSNVLRDLLPKYVQDDAHLPAGVHYLTTVADLFLPNSFL
ncbi:hypothetical protein V3C99_017441 [Haemonchus contortus]|uniref:Warthog protein 6 n=1 Tax=Haemonchus contortus TaxID=6289 RepID=A0A7I5EEW2_HAECO